MRRWTAGSRRVAPDRPRPRSLLVLPGYLVLTLAALWPILRRFGSAIPSGAAPFDPPFQAFLLGWDWRALTTNPASIFDAPIFHPEPRTLTYMDHMIGEALVASPIFAAGGSLAAGYNFLVLLSFVLTAWGAYRLTRLFGVRRSGAFLAGLFFALCPYRFANLDLLNQLQTQFLPWGLFFAVRYVHRRKLRDGVGVMAALAVQVYFGWYYAYFLVLGLIVVAGHAWRERAPGVPRRHWGRLSIAAGLGLLAILPVTGPYLVERVSMPGFRRTLGQAALYSADLFDYFRSNAWMTEVRVLGLPSGPQSYWPGLIAMTLGVVGAIVVLRARARLASLPLSLGASGVVLSLGPLLHVGGHAIPIPLPYALLYFTVPGFSSMRAPARFAVLVALAAAVLAGVGYGRLEERLGRRGLRRAAFAAVVLAALGLALFRPIGLLELPSRKTVPPIYRQVAAQPGDAPLLEIPVPATDGDENQLHAMRQLLVLYHGKRRLDGTSGFVSGRYREFRRVMQSFPADSAIGAARAMGARLILVHYGDYAPGARGVLDARAAATAALTPVAREGDDALYMLGP